MSDEPTAQEVHETLYDGADLTIVFKDGSSDTVKIRKIPRSHFGKYAEIIQEESEDAEFREAALYLGSVVSVRNLTDESLDAVLAEGERLNFTSFARWFRRRARMPSLLQGRQDLVNLAMEAMSRLTPRASTNGSAPSGTATPTSGATARKS